MKIFFDALITVTWIALLAQGIYIMKYSKFVVKGAQFHISEPESYMLGSVILLFGIGMALLHIRDIYKR